MTGPQTQFEGPQTWYTDPEAIVERVEDRGQTAVNSGSCDMPALRDLCADRGWTLTHECAEVWIVEA